MNPPDLSRLLAATLVRELGDPALARRVAAIVRDVALAWTPDTVDPARIDTIAAYSFGNRPNPASGVTAPDGANQAALPDPGPVNAELADVVAALGVRTGARVYAQWEIAAELATRHGPAATVAILPETAPDGTIVYLNTDGVARKVVQLAGGDPAALGTVAVVAHRDHVRRCIDVSRHRGMNAWAAAGTTLPATYDPLSGHAWTRSRELYLIHDMMLRLADRRACMLEGQAG